MSAVTNPPRVTHDGQSTPPVYGHTRINDCDHNPVAESGMIPGGDGLTPPVSEVLRTVPPVRLRTVRTSTRPLAMLGVLLGVVVGTHVASAQWSILHRDDYADRLRAMWLGQTIANWTGLRTEGRVTQPPFLTDDDWERVDLGRGLVTYVLDQDPWGADDDTDIEYVYAHLLHHLGVNRLTGRQIADGWVDHVNRFIWVSNAEARALMDRGVVPPATSIPAANRFWLKIDAQLTTEFFGAICPAMPSRALAMSELPIRTTAGGHAAHAAQVFVLLHSLAFVATNEELVPSARVVRLVQQARWYIPNESKAADIIDFVLADFFDNPDKDDWERTRDRVYERYQRDAAVNGFVYRAWTESSVNFASGLIALLYGQGDYRRTIRIGTLTGWDSDNGTATMGALVAMMIGYDELLAQFPQATLSERFWISRTRDNLPDWLPKDPEAEDTFEMMAHRMIPIIEREIMDAGGLVLPTGHWLIPWEFGEPLGHNPLVRQWRRSANNMVREAGGTVSAASSASGASPPSQRGRAQAARFADGLEGNFSGRENLVDSSRWYYSSQGASLSGGVVTLTVTYDREVELSGVRFVEGDHFDDALGRGGWFEDIALHLRIGGVWTEIPIGGVGGAEQSEPLDPVVPFQIIDWRLPVPVVATGIRISGRAGGADVFVTCAEIDGVLAAPW